MAAHSRRGVRATHLGRAAPAAALLLCLASATVALAAGGAGEQWPRIALVLDASGSMWAELEGRTRIEVARSAIRELVADWDARAELGLTAYGHRTRRDCDDIETLLPVGPADPAALVEAVDGIRPVGMTPLAASIEHAAQALDADRRAATVILVSDGNETCGRDPCAVARTLAESGADFTVHVVGFDVTAAERGQLQCIAEATGGLFIDARGAAGLGAALRAAFDDIARRSFAPPLWLGASLASGSPPLDEPIAWRISPVDDRGEPGPPVMEATSPTLSSRLRGGRYRVEAALDGVAATLDLEVDPAVQAAHVLSFEAAALHVAAVDRSETAIERDVHWRVDASKPPGRAVREAAGGATRFLLPEGRYRVSSRHGGDTVARVLVVRPGQNLKKRFQFGIGKLALRAILAEGRQPIQDPMEWVVRDADGETVRQGRSASALYTLATGSYRVEVVHGQARASAPVAVRSGITVIETLDLHAGRVGLYGALPAPGGPISDPILWRVRAADGTEYRSERAASEWVLPVGEYRAVGRRGPWRGEASWVVRPGARSLVPVTFRPLDGFGSLETRTGEAHRTASRRSR
ncbi:MAG: vWA domain-containing protein [Myxococcota bacterium]